KFWNFWLFSQKPYVLPDSSFTFATQVFLSVSYAGLPMNSGVESCQAVDQLHEPSCMGLLNVTRISVSPGGISVAPDSGMVFTTTGGIEVAETSIPTALDFWLKSATYSAVFA